MAAKMACAKSAQATFVFVVATGMLFEGVFEVNKLVIDGGIPLSGEIAVHGAKNSSLPLLAATILSGGECVLHNCPALSDVDAACKILSYLGCGIRREGSTVTVNTENLSHFDVPDDLMQEMRSSIVFLGAIAARLGRVRISFPGGCDLGARPIDLHLSALRQLGLDIREEHGYLNCVSDGRLKGSNISLSFPSVGATENIILAAATARGQTVINNAAQEPEIVDLAEFLNRCGAKIYGAGKSRIWIDGVETLYGSEHKVIPDRIVAVTYLCCAAVTGGEVQLLHTRLDDIGSVLPVLEGMGCVIRCLDDTIFLKAPKRLNGGGTIRTMPYPGFPTDAQAPLMALSTLSDSTTVFVENIFENRFRHAGELIRMGANIRTEGKIAVVQGVPRLYGASVQATDLRGGAALIIAGLAAQGKTIISNMCHVQRGYEDIEGNLKAMGAQVYWTD